jgi:hypothetical protein
MNNTPEARSTEPPSSASDYQAFASRPVHAARVAGPRASHTATSPVIPTYLPTYLSTQPRTCICVRLCEWAGSVHPSTRPSNTSKPQPREKPQSPGPPPPSKARSRKHGIVLQARLARRHASGHRHRHTQARVTCGKACVRRQRSCVLRKLPAVCHGSACATEACVRACMRACVRVGVRAGVPLAYVYVSCLLCLSSVIGGFWAGLHGAGRAAR